MPAYVEIMAGPSSGRELRISQSALRIGRSPSCEVEIADPDVAEHAVTLRFRDGVYSAYNHTSSELRLGNGVLPSRQSAEWPAGVELKLSRRSSVRLNVNGEPIPLRREKVKSSVVDVATADIQAPVENVVKEVQTRDEQQHEPHKSPSGAPQLIVIGACIVFGALLIVSKLTKDSDVSADQEVVELEDLLVRISKQRKQLPAENALEHIQEALRIAYRLETQGDSDAAAQQRIRVLRILRRVAQIDPARTKPKGQWFDNALYDDILTYISQNDSVEGE